MKSINILRLVYMVAIVVILILFIGCIKIVIPRIDSSISGSGNLQTRQLDISNFNKVEVGHAFKVDVSKTNAYMVKITMDDNLFDYLDVRKYGDTLQITLKPNNSYRNTAQEAVINMPELHGLSLSGASRGKVSGFSSRHTLDIRLSGASFLHIDNLKAGNMTYNISGASKMYGNVDILDGDFDMSGASNITLKGTGDNIKMDISGASNVNLLDFSVKNAIVFLSGASTANVRASERLDIDASGASHLYYIGNPILGRINTSGGSNINKE